MPVYLHRKELNGLTHLGRSMRAERGAWNVAGEIKTQEATTRRVGRVWVGRGEGEQV